MSLPQCIDDQIRSVLPTRINDLPTFEFLVPVSGHYIHSINFHCNPLLIDRHGNYDQYRLSAGDVDAVDLVVNHRIMVSIPNTDPNNDPVLHRDNIGGIHTTYIDFFQDLPIITGALRPDTDIRIRISFWREPLAPFWLTYTIGHTYNPRSLLFNMTVPTFNGHECIYSGGFLLKKDLLYN